MPSRSGNTRALQVVMIALLLVCVAQVVYWIIDQERYVEANHRARLAGFESELRAAQELLGTGMVMERVVPAFDHLTFEEGRVEIDARALALLDADRRRRLNRYRWEGSFFLVVLVTGVAIVSQALRQRARLVHRQENFVAAVSHELKSPLASLRLSAETLQLRRPDMEAAARLAERMVRDVERLEEMVANILDAGRIASGGLLLAAETFELSAELEALVEQSERQAQEKRVALSLEVTDGLLARGDRNAFHTVIRNLVSNAIKSTAASGGGQVVVRGREEDGRILLEVEDDGLGFESDEAERLFEKFYRAGDELQRRTPGSGLGLYIAERLSSASGARIAAASAGPGRGATFRVWWPQDRGGAA